MSNSKPGFGWKTLDNASIPYLLRGKKKYVSVRIVEQKLLLNYPNTYPEGTEPLEAVFPEEHEVELLNEINSVHCVREYGPEKFGEEDRLIGLVEFERFYDAIKKHHGAACNEMHPSKECEAVGNQANFMEGREAVSIQADSVEGCEAVSIQADSMDGCEAASIQADSMNGCEAVSIQADSMEGNEAVSIQANTVQDHEAVSIQADSMEGREAFSIQASTMEDHESVSIQANTMKDHESVSNRENYAKAGSNLTLSIKDHGWLQINNTVIPYVLQNETKFVPLSILRYAAGLLTDVMVRGTEMLEKERHLLTTMCREVGIHFEFTELAKLVPLPLLLALCRQKLVVKELPGTDPLNHVEFHPEFDKVDETHQTSSAAVPGVVDLTSDNQSTELLPAKDTSSVNPPVSSVLSAEYRDQYQDQSRMASVDCAPQMAAAASEMQDCRDKQSPDHPASNQLGQVPVYGDDHQGAEPVLQYAPQWSHFEKNQEETRNNMVHSESIDPVGTSYYHSTSSYLFEGNRTQQRAAQNPYTMYSAGQEAAPNPFYAQQLALQNPSMNSTRQRQAHNQFNQNGIQPGAARGSFQTNRQIGAAQISYDQSHHTATHGRDIDISPMTESQTLRRLNKISAQLWHRGLRPNIPHEQQLQRPYLAPLTGNPQVPSWFQGPTMPVPRQQFSLPGQGPPSSLVGQRLTSCLPAQRPQSCLPAQRPPSSLHSHRLPSSTPAQGLRWTLPAQGPPSNLSAQRPPASPPAQRPPPCLPAQRPNRNLPAQRPPLSFHAQRPPSSLPEQRPLPCRPAQRPLRSPTAQRSQPCLPAQRLPSSLRAQSHNYLRLANFTNNANMMQHLQTVDSLHQTYGQTTDHNLSRKKPNILRKTGSKTIGQQMPGQPGPRQPGAALCNNEMQIVMKSTDPRPQNLPPVVSSNTPPQPSIFGLNNFYTVPQGLPKTMPLHGETSTNPGQDVYQSISPPQTQHSLYESISPLTKTAKRSSAQNQATKSKRKSPPHDKSPDGATSSDEPTPPKKRRRKASKNKNRDSEPCLLGEINKSQFPGMTPPVFPGMLTPEPEPVVTPPGELVNNASTLVGPTPVLTVPSSTTPGHSLRLLTDPQVKCLQEIQEVLVGGLPLFCLMRGNHAFVLLEGIVPLFFPGQSVQSLQLLIENLIGCKLTKASDDEEIALICYYRLPVKKLNTRIIIQVKQFEKLLPLLKNILSHENAFCINSVCEDAVTPDNNIGEPENCSANLSSENPSAADGDKQYMCGMNVQVQEKSLDKNDSWQKIHRHEKTEPAEDLLRKKIKSEKIEDLNDREHGHNRLKTTSKQVTEQEHEPRNESTEITEQEDEQNINLAEINEQEHEQKNESTPVTDEVPENPKESSRVTEQRCEQQMTDSTQMSISQDQTAREEKIPGKKGNQKDRNLHENSTNDVANNCFTMMSPYKPSQPLKSLTTDNQLQKSAQENIVNNFVAQAFIAKLATCTPSLDKKPVGTCDKETLENLPIC